jgi:hypothetical protein
MRHALQPETGCFSLEDAAGAAALFDRLALSGDGGAAGEEMDP